MCPLKHSRKMGNIYPQRCEVNDPVTWILLLLKNESEGNEMQKCFDVRNQ